MITVKFNLEAGQLLSLCGVDLTPRESAVVARLVEEQTRDQIAEVFSCSVRTIEGYLYNIYGATGLSSEYEVAVEVVKQYKNRISLEGDDGLSYDAQVAKLTKREKQVLEYLMEGESFKAISGHMGVSNGTTRSHAANMYIKLDLKNVVKAVVVMGLLSQERDKSNVLHLDQTALLPQTDNSVPRQNVG